MGGPRKEIGMRSERALDNDPNDRIDASISLHLIPVSEERKRRANEHQFDLLSDLKRGAVRL